MGNSEVGHITIGSGILRYQSLPRIDKSISTGEFFRLPGMLKVIERMKQPKSKFHLIGLLGNGGVHASGEHLEALVSFAKTAGFGNRTFLHLFLDGRDTAKDLGAEFVKRLTELLKKEKTGSIASISGRFFGMDRNKNWDRIEKAYQAIVYGQSVKSGRDPIELIKESYAKEIFDEEFEPAVITDRNNKPAGTIEDGDAVIFFNFRADRARQLTQTFVTPKFDKFKTKTFENLMFLTFTEYEKNLPVSDILFAPEITQNPIAKVFSDYNLKQIHIAETEKYAHVTFFLNGMREQAFSGEDRILVPSPAVTSYDQKPEMSAEEVTKNVIEALRSNKYSFMTINYANPDMVGHTGNLLACVKAIETVDACLKKLITEALKQQANIFIVGDHGNAEEMINLATGEVDKEHNNYPVPFLIIGEQFAGQNNPDAIAGDLSILNPVGILSDVAPTILSVVGLDRPAEMTGTSLI